MAQRQISGPTLACALKACKPDEKETGIMSSVKAILRVRPFLGNESSARPAIDVSHNLATITNPRNPSESLVYHFDSCYGEDSRQREIFNNDLVPLIDHVLAGYNSTVFAYGNTGAGKTFTMQGTTEDPGMIPLAVADIINRLSVKQSKFQLRWALKVSYLEIYKEKVYDLLVEGNPGIADLAIREDQLRNIIVPNLSEVSVRTSDDFNKVFECGIRNRSTAATKLNSQSSRSHACLLLNVEQRPPIGLPVKAKLFLIDLAGSEDNRKTENRGDRLVESGAINGSLFVLGQVVDALNKKASRIPYRESKLTRLLQDSLGGRSYALIITNVAPIETYLLDTFNSLSFASKSRQIRNRVVENAQIEKEKENHTKARHQAGEDRAQLLEVWKKNKQQHSSKRKPCQGKKRTRASDDEEEEFEDNDSIYDVSEMDPASSVQSKARTKKLPIISPPETTEAATGKPLVKSSNLGPNPFVDSKNSMQANLLEKQIEEKVAARLREISKGTILSPLLKGRTINELDMKGIKKAVKKPSALSKLADQENEDPKGNAAVKRPKSTKQQALEATIVDQISGILNMFPSVEPDFLHILNHGTLKQIKALKEFGQSRAEQIVSIREQQAAGSQPLWAFAIELVDKRIFTAKVLNRIIYANAMDADGLAAQAHAVQPRV